MAMGGGDIITLTPTIDWWRNRLKTLLFMLPILSSNAPSSFKILPLEHGAQAEWFLM